MAKPLLSLNTLLRAGWQEYLAHWNQTTRLTVWLLVVPVVQLLIVLGLPGSALSEGSWAILLLNIVHVLVTFWVITRVVKWYLAESHGDTKHLHDARSALESLPSLTWVMVLKGLAVAGGLLLAVVPGIWLSVLLDFAYVANLEDGKKGQLALQHSASLVKGRWFPVFGRMAVYTLLFLIAAMVIQYILTLIVSGISGLSLGSVDWNQLADPAVAKYVMTTDATLNVVAAVSQAIILPLLFTWQIRLYKDLKATR